MMWVTRAVPGESGALGQLMFRAIRDGATLYTPAQRAAWAPKPFRGRNWTQKLARQKVWVARGTHGPVGIVTLRRDGYVDLAFVLKTAQRKGVFRTLMAALEADHDGAGLSTHASLHAQPAFAAVGFNVVHHETVRARGQRLRRAFMTKSPN